MKKALIQYHNFLCDVRHLSNSTVLSYERDIKHFQNFFGKNLKKASCEDFTNYISEMKRHGSTDATVSRNMVSLRSLFSFMKESGLIKKDPTKEIDLPKVKKTLPQILTSAEISLLLETPSGNDPKSYRDKAMLELLYATGIKVSELISLNVSHINLRRGMLNCTISANPRIIPLGNVAMKALNTYLKNGRNALISSADETALFVNYSGKRMTRQGFWKIVKHYKEKAEIDKEITPHTLRHSFAAHLLENGADIDLIGEMMGLTDSASTAVYKKIIENRLFDVYKKAHPRA